MKKKIVKKHPAKGILKVWLFVSVYLTAITTIGAVIGGIIAAAFSASSQKV